MTLFDQQAMAIANSEKASEGNHFTDAACAAAVPSFRNKRPARIAALAITLANDCIVLGAAFLLAGMLRSNGVAASGSEMAAVMLGLYLAVAANTGALSVDALGHARVGGRRALRAIAATAIALAFIIYLLKVGDSFSRLVFGVGSTLAMVALPVSRIATARIVRRIGGANLMTRVLITDGVDVPRLAGHFRLDAAAADLSPRAGCRISMTRLAEQLKEADRVVVACPPNRRAAWAVALKGLCVDAQIYMPELGDLGPLGIGRIDAGPTIRIAAGPMPRGDRLLKRGLDLGLILFAAPFLVIVSAAIALAIKLDTPGPVLFRQSRIGMGSRAFTLFKFRSMHYALLDADGAQSTRRGDARITRVGRFIRATSLDELPQLLNVLIGDMSLVGPRPHALGSTASDRAFWDIDERYWHRHAAKPGLTGLAQVRGFRGATHAEADLVNRLQADLEYLNDWSILRDLVIIATTLRSLSHKNAY